MDLRLFLVVNHSHGKEEIAMKHRRHSPMIVVAGMLLLEVALSDTPNRIEIPFRLRGHYIVVNASIGDLENLQCIIDTGCSSPAVSRQVAKKLNLSGRRKKGNALGRSVRIERVTLPVASEQSGSTIWSWIPGFG